LNVGNNQTLLPNTVAQFSLAGGSYIQTNLVNIDDGGTADLVVTANTGTDSTYFLDAGFANKDFQPGLEFNNLGTAIYPLDGYLYAAGQEGHLGGNLVIGSTTTGTDVKFIAGGHDSGNVVFKVTADGLKMVNGHPVFFTDGTTQNTAGAPFAYSNSIFVQANAAFLVANTHAAVANSAALYANAAFIQANAAFLVSNTPPAIANSAALYANAAFLQANSAYNKANNALANTSGTFAGDLAITGNLSLLNGSVSAAGNMTVNGTVVMANSNFSAAEAAVTIKATANVALPSNDGYMLHISGKQNTASRIVFDSYSVTGNAYAVVAGRTARGTVDAPLAVANGDILMRVSGNGRGTTNWTQYGVARMDIVATEDYTDAKRGSQIQFWNCPIGSNTLQQIATFNGDSVHFSGVVNPQKGLLLSPNVLSGITTTLNIDIANNSLYRFVTNATTTINLSGFQTGKIVEVWLTNTDTGGGSNHTITHGCLANNSTIGATSFTLTSLHSAYIKYFSIDGDQANTFCQVTYS
jgi:hypothetical protein